MIEGLSGRLAVVAVSGVLAVSVLGGCAGSGQSTSSSASSEASESVSSSSAEADAAESADLVFGSASDDTAVVMLANETGSAVEDVAIARAGSGSEPVALVAEEGVWGSGKTAAVYLGSAGSGAYDVALSIGDATYVLHGVDADEVDEAAVRIEGDVAYLVYEAPGGSVSTLQDETGIAEAERAAAAAEAEAAAAEAEAAAAASAEPTYSYDDAAPAQPAQSEDSCVDGGVVLR